MKTVILFFLLPATLLFGRTASGQQYEVTYSSDPYVSLSEANLVNEDDPNMSTGVALYLNIPIGFDFTFQGETYSELAVSEDGYVIFSVEGALVSFISFLDADLKDFQDDPAQSPIYYTLEGDVGNRIFKLEMENVGFTQDLEGDESANVQLWLYENCNDFEIRLGESTVDAMVDNLFWSGNTSPFFAYGVYNPSSVYILAGDPTAPFQQTSPFNTINAMPESGTVYTFSDCDVSVEEEELVELSLFPNPTTDVVYVQLMNASEVRIFNMNGVVVAEIQANQNMLSFDVSSFASGTYMLQVISDEGVESTRFVKL